MNAEKVASNLRAAADFVERYGLDRNYLFCVTVATLESPELFVQPAAFLALTKGRPVKARTAPKDGIHARCVVDGIRLVCDVYYGDAVFSTFEKFLPEVSDE